MSIGDSMKKLIGIEELEDDEITEEEVQAAKEKNGLLMSRLITIKKNIAIQKKKCVPSFGQN